MRKTALFIFIVLLSVYLPAQEVIDNYCGVYKCAVKRKRTYNADPNIYYTWDTINLYISLDTTNATQLFFIDSTFINDPEFIIDSNTYIVLMDTITDHFTTEFLYGGHGDFFLTNDSIQMYISGGSGLWGSVAWYYYGKKALVDAIIDYERKTVNIFPNPVKNKLNIELLNKTKSANCFIYNLNGQLILSKEFTDNTSINVSYFKKGIYFLFIKNNNKRFVKKIIIN